VGEPADPRARSAGKRHGVSVTSLARTVEAADFERFDVVVAMDRGHLRWLRARCAPAGQAKLRLLRAIDPEADDQDVPAPCYAGSEAFERVYAILERCCRRLLAELSA
jgi:protein-tyrosine phosphatase